jgi:arylsulfatase A-like enzyme
MMALSLLAAALGAAAAEASASPPNVLIVLTDDQGWGDTGTTVASWCAHPPALSADSPAAVCPAHRSGCRSQGSVAYSKRNTTACPRTPHIDALATGPHSVLFHRFYSGAGVCSPTRASVLTGRNNKRSCIDSALPCDHMATEADGCSQGPGLAKTEFTVAKAAAKVGMATMHLGKVRVRKSQCCSAASLSITFV